jgi:hypothetical protein
MAIAQCPECGNEVSDRAPSCPHCGIVYDYGDTAAPRGGFLFSFVRSLIPLLLFAAYIYFAGVEYFHFPNDADAQRAMALANFMGSSIGISGDGYFLNSETAFVLIENTYHGLSFSETPPISMPILQNMFVVVGGMVGAFIGAVLGIVR